MFYQITKYLYNKMSKKKNNLNDNIRDINISDNFITQQKLGGCIIQKAQDKILIQLDIQTPK